MFNLSWSDPDYLHGRVLVIGASADYIDAIYKRYPQRVVFVTDPVERIGSAIAAPDKQNEIVVPLDKTETVLERISVHMEQHGLQPSGIACFDCESMLPASLAAQHFSLSYPSPEAVLASRSKLSSKRLWRQAGLDCPAAAEIQCAGDVASFQRNTNTKKIILKPLTGSGSELIFLCETADEWERALAIMRKRLSEMAAARMYAPYEIDGRRINPRQTFAAEEYIEGAEYSCDFAIEGNSIQIIRIARKWLKPGTAPGTVWAYTLPEREPLLAGTDGFKNILRTAAHALGIRRSLCMLDFVMSGDRIKLLEIAPRPGGDCLIPLIHLSSGLDMLGLALDFAEQQAWRIPETGMWKRLVGLRLFAPRSGVITAIDASRLRSDPRVLAVEIARQPGHCVKQPPEDYHSRILGYAVFQPSSPKQIVMECSELHEKLAVEYTTGGNR